MLVVRALPCHSRSCGFESRQTRLFVGQEAGQQIMGASATELKELEQADLPAFEARVHATHFKPILLKVKIAEDTYNDETRIKTSIMRCALTGSMIVRVCTVNGACKGVLQ